MWQLFNIIPLLVGQKFQKDDEYYCCFMLLQEISTILCSDVMTEDQPAYLRVLIAEYLEKMVELHPDKPLTPKLHYLIHCPIIMKRYAGAEKSQFLISKLSFYFADLVHCAGYGA